MAFIMYLIGSIMIAISVGNIYSPAIGFITLGSLFIFGVILDEVKEYFISKNKTT